MNIRSCVSAFCFAFGATVAAANAACPDATTVARGFALTRSDGAVEQVLPPQPDGSVLSLTDAGGVLTETVRFEGLLLLRVTAVKGPARSTTVFEYLGPELLKLFPLKSGAELTLGQRVTQNGTPSERKLEIAVRGNEKVELGECS